MKVIKVCAIYKNMGIVAKMENAAYCGYAPLWVRFPSILLFGDLCNGSTPLSESDS